MHVLFSFGPPDSRLLGHRASSSVPQWSKANIQVPIGIPALRPVGLGLTLT